MSTVGKVVARAALYASAAAGAYFLMHAAAASADEQKPPPSVGSVLTTAGKLLPERVVKPLENGNGDIGVGDARPSDPATKTPAPGEKNPPFNRAHASAVPRVGVGYNVATGTIRWSYDLKPPVDTGVVTSHLPLPKPTVHRVLPGDFGVVQNHASHLEQDNRTADGPRHPTDPNKSDWNLTTTDVLLPGGSRVLRFDMVCPNHAGWSEDHGDHHFDGTYTGATKYDLQNGHLVFSYQWGDKVFNNAFIEAHYIAYGLSNDS
ncbi:hypothetical protein [Fodinicola acaciae]|uniref:hypothetical protein n=1 Tax=Fodinicola acaciae TaxID=2681555 RepID=UPI0013D3B8C6|nr:hypothetical protein [Fodinicola acaciae]